MVYHDRDNHPFSRGSCVPMYQRQNSKFRSCEILRRLQYRIIYLICVNRRMDRLKSSQFKIEKLKLCRKHSDTKVEISNPNRSAERARSEPQQNQNASPASWLESSAHGLQMMGVCTHTPIECVHTQPRGEASPPAGGRRLSLGPIRPKTRTGARAREDPLPQGLIKGTAVYTNTSVAND